MTNNPDLKRPISKYSGLNEYATPRHLQALAEMIHLVGYAVDRHGREQATTDAAQLRRLADILDGRT